MKSFLSFLAILIFLSSSPFLNAQEKNKGVFKESKSGFIKRFKRELMNLKIQLKKKRNLLHLIFLE